MKELIQLLQANEWYDGDEYIQIAKGKYHHPSTFKGWFQKIKRKLKIKQSK
jgi:hypothetical protein